MKQGRTLEQIWQEVKRQRESKKDYIVPLDKMQLELVTFEGDEAPPPDVQFCIYAGVHELEYPSLDPEATARCKCGVWRLVTMEFPGFTETTEEQVARVTIQFAKHVSNGRTENIEEVTTLEYQNVLRYGLTEIAHRQLATYLDIPGHYYQRQLAVTPSALVSSVNAWLQAKHDPQRKAIARMVRTLDGKVRALLSPRYRPLDNFDLMSAILPELLGENSPFEVQSCEVTEKRLYINAVTPEVKGFVVGDEVQGMIKITNSEVGQGGFSIVPGAMVLSCRNGMKTPKEFAMNVKHVGRSQLGEERSFEMLSDETLKAKDTAFFLEVRDTVRSVVTAESFSKFLTVMQAAAERPIEGNIETVVTQVQERYALTDDERTGVLDALFKQSSGHTPTQWDMANAITSYAQNDDVSYDRSQKLEEIGGVFVSLDQSDFQAVVRERASGAPTAVDKSVVEEETEGE